MRHFFAPFKLPNWSVVRRNFVPGSQSQGFQAIQERSKQRMRTRSFLWTLMILCLPLSCLSLYDRLASLPEPLDKHNFPILARFYIRKALWRDVGNPEKGRDIGLDGVAKDLDSALWAVLASGLGAASPQATSILVYLSKRYMEDPRVSDEKLEQALIALLHKPHVGEALEEESTRLNTSLDVAKVLLDRYRLAGDENKVKILEQRMQTGIKKCPPVLSRKLQDKLNRFDFK